MKVDRNKLEIASAKSLSEATGMPLFKLRQRNGTGCLAERSSGEKLNLTEDFMKIDKYEIVL